MESMHFRIQREADIYIALSAARRLADELRFSDVDRTKVEISLLELAHNQIRHAGGGVLLIRAVQRTPAEVGIEIEARDQGPGIPNIDLALQDGYSTIKSLGAGLPGVRRLMDEMKITSTPGQGTTVWAVKWRANR